MDKKTTGAWLIHHTNKLKEISNPNLFPNIGSAGKCGLLLSGLAESERESNLSKEKVEAIASVSDIDLRFELPVLLEELQSEKIINIGKTGDVYVLGVTTPKVLTHTSEVFTKHNPENKEKAVIDIAEKVSESPISSNEITEYVGDSYMLTKEKSKELIFQAEDIGFIDGEDIGEGEKLLFNGNMFRKDASRNKQNIIASLSSEDDRKILEFNGFLDKGGCVPYTQTIKILGESLFSKLQSIGMYDVNEVSNAQENVFFVTKPSAFAKYGDSFVEDALDLAKAFVSSLYYGMNNSASSRGRIQLLDVLLRRLIQGQWVGSATAIGQDYNFMVYKRVIEIKADPEKPGRFFMRLLKKEIGEIALQVLDLGNASDEVLLKSSNAFGYNNPEYNRTITRKRQTKKSKQEMAELLRVLR